MTSKSSDLLDHLASRPGRDEVKADFRALLVVEFGAERSALEFEKRVPVIRGRLDALIGRTVFEAKRDLTREWADVVRKMPEYLADREREEGEKFVGLASDGARWAAFELEGGELVTVKETTLDPEQPEVFLAWLDGIVALKSSLPSDPLTVRAELGRESLAFRRADAELESLWERLKTDPAVHLKRRLWAELLKLVYGRDVDSDELWRQHTFLVIVAKCAALAVMGLHEDEPKRLLSGDAFVAAGIEGAVESDFFDWIVADSSGEALVRRIMAHVRRFRLAEVHSDILKILYESLIDRDERHGLGEYYTPDWLAAKIVKAAVDRPLELKVLDPACGSGTFLFHAIRLFLAEAEDAGLDPKQRAFEVSQHIAGMDIHPVAVIIARVTYLLALAPALAKRAGAIFVPVYLGDAMQVSISQSMGAFDKLRREGRDSVWAYVARNLARPLALSTGGGWANVVVGNPPWVAYRHMSADLQQRFKELAKGARVYVGGKFGTQNDLCALFTVRAASLYLRSAGRIAFVLPMAVLTRGQYETLRRGSFDPACIQWDDAWVMNDDVQPLFPVPSCVLFGRRRATSKPVPEEVRIYSGALPMRDAPEELVDRLIAEGKFTVTEKAPRPTEGVFTGGSAYRSSFRQGATLVPRMLCFVERKPMGRLGADRSAPVVMSRRSSQEKKPWRDLPGIENRVDAEFLRPVLLGESILPYRVWRPFEAVVPVDSKGVVLDAEAALNRGFDGLNGWMRKAEKLWKEHAESAAMTLVGRWDYHKELSAQFDYYGKLSAQFPLAPLRVVYAASGTQPAACVVRDPKMVIDTKLYWFAPTSPREASYLAAILNSETTRARAEKWQSRGQWGARDFHKVMFNLPIPRFDASAERHLALARAGARAEKLAAAVQFPDDVKFQRARKLVRDALNEAGAAQDIDALVENLLDQ